MGIHQMARGCEYRTHPIPGARKPICPGPQLEQMQAGASDGDSSSVPVELQGTWFLWPRFFSPWVGSSWQDRVWGGPASGSPADGAGGRGWVRLTPHPHAPHAWPPSAPPSNPGSFPIG